MRISRLRGSAPRPRPAAWVGTLLTLLACAAQAQPFVFSAGTRGSVFPCASCPKGTATGGWMRAAPLLREHREQHPRGAWFDLGNAFTGGDLPPDKLSLLPGIYSELGVDAMNVAAGDFRHGFDFLHRLLAESDLPVVSANLVGAGSEELLFPPGVTVSIESGDLRVIGLTEAPAGRDLLPHLRKQFKGVDFLPLSDALKTQVEAVPEDTAVGVLYDGSARGLREILRVAGAREDGGIWIAASSDAVRVAGNPPAGIHLIPVAPDGSVFTRVHPGEDPRIREVPLPSRSEPDGRIRNLLKENGVPFPSTSTPDTPSEIPPEVSLEGLQTGETLTVRRSASNRGLRVAVHGLEPRTVIGDLQAPPGRRFAVLDLSFENRQAIDLLLEMDYPEPLMIGELRNQLFLIHGGVVVASPLVLPEALPGGLPQTFTLSSTGDRARGKVAFDLPVETPDGLSLVYVPELFPALEVVLAGPSEGRALKKKVAEDASSGFLELGAVSVSRKKEIDGFRASEGMEWAVVDLLGRSLNPLELDARAVDVEAAPDAKHRTYKAAVYMHGRDMLQLVVDGRHAYRYDPDLSELETEPVFPPGRVTGGRVVYPIPEDAESLQLYAGFPDFKSSGGVIRPGPIELNLEGRPPGRDNWETLATIGDSPLPIDVTGVVHDRENGTVRIEATVRNTGEQGGMYEASSRGRLRGPDGAAVEPLRVELKGGLPLDEPLWIPADERPRSFSYVFEAPSDVEDVVFSYSGVAKSGTMRLDLSPDGTPERGRVAGVEETDEAGPALETGHLLNPLPLVSEGASPELPSLAWDAPGKKNKNEVVVEPPGEGIPVKQNAGGDGFTLTAHRLFVLTSYYGEEAEEGWRWLAVELEFQRLPGLEGPVEIFDLDELLLLRTTGRRLRGMQRFGGTDPQLTYPIRLDEQTPSVRNFVFYPVPENDLAAVELLLAERGRTPAAMKLLPAEGPLPDIPEPALVAENRVVELGLFGAEIRESFQGRSASEGAWLTMDLRGRSRLRSEADPETGAPEGTLRYEWREYRPRVQLILDGVRTVLLDGNGFDFYSEDELLPELWSGGRFAFNLSPDALESAGTVQLQCGFMPAAVPGERVVAPETLYFTLKGDPETLPGPPKPMRSLEDLNLTVDLIRASRPDTVDGREAGKGASWLRVDLGITATADQGVWYDPGFLSLITPGRGVMRPNRHSWYGPDAPPNRSTSSWIPKGGRREFSMFWQVKEGDRPVRLRVNGVKHYGAVDLFPDENRAAGDAPDPEADRLISEQGIRVLNPDREPAGIAGVGLAPEQVNLAIDRGRDFLWAEVRKEFSSGRRSLHGEFFPAVLALVHCDAHLEFPEFDRELRRLIRESRVDDNTVYENALLAMVIEGYGDPSFLPKMEQIAHWLVETQGEEGTWSYRAPVPSRFFPKPEPDAEPDKGAVLRVAGGERREKVEPPEEPIHRTQPWERGKNGDHSCTQFAVLGLWSAERSGVPIDDDVWERVLTRMSRHQTLGKEKLFGGFGYNGPGGAYGSMTGAGICVLAIAQDRLFDDLTPREHLRNRNALGWLVRNFSVTENPGTKKYNFYYLYSLERVGQILGIEFMGDHEWYPLGADYLVGRQNGDGSWPSGPSEGDPVLTSSYALLFLTRATPELDAEAEPEPTGPGKLATVVKRPEVRHQVYLILDASGSMRSEIGGKRKLDIAREAVGGLLHVLPKETRVAVRAYGHRKRAIEPGAEEDTELVVSWTDLDPAAIRRSLDTLRPMGKTPMALSLKQAAGDIRGGGEGRTLLVLLTDGGEDSRDSDPVAAASAFAGREDVEFFILGFDINRPDWTRQLKAMAAAGEGVYRPVDDATALARDLKAVVYPPVPEFQLLDGEGSEVARATFGAEPLELPGGDYSLRAPGFNADFHIRAGGTTRITLDMANLPQSDGPAAASQTEAAPADEAPASGGPAFCTQCGDKLAPDAKFCTSCGNPVR